MLFGQQVKITIRSYYSAIGINKNEMLSLRRNDRSEMLGLWMVEQQPAPLENSLKCFAETTATVA